MKSPIALDELTALLKSFEKKPWVLAVSGGIDSTVLLHLIHTLHIHKHLQLKEKPLVLHINHALRGKESDGDELFVKNMAQSLGFPFCSYTLQWGEKEKKSQNACRTKREEIYQSLLKKNPEIKILLAHNANDQAETLFQRLLRGTGIRGLKGMTQVEENKIRPLLFILRSQIQRYANINDIKWREDSSNKKNTYERNWLRNEVFPEFEKRRPGFQKRLVALSKEEAESFSEKKTIPLASSLDFQMGEFFSKKNLLQLNEATLSKCFLLNRAHAIALKKFLQKDSGFYPMPKGIFWLSCDFVLYIRGKTKINEPLFPIEFTQKEGKSILGVWKIKGEGEFALKSPAQAQRLKQSFIKRKIPAFFRNAIPALENLDHKKTFLLAPRALAQKEEWVKNGLTISYTPSAKAKQLFKNR